MSASLRVRRVVLFHHGVCYLERGGPADGPFELVFRRHEMNEVLKSLAIWVASGNARVQGVAFEPPAEPTDALDDRNLRFGPSSALEDWLASLRGRPVRVRTPRGPLEGKILGLDARSGAPTLLLCVASGSVELLPLADLVGVEALDPQSRLDLDFALDRVRAATAGDRRSLRVSLAGKADDLRVACVVPSTPWRLSYRLLRQIDTTLLIGWGLVHNPADEDLDDVELTLTSAQPVSFMANLYETLDTIHALPDDEAPSPPALPPQGPGPTINEETRGGTILLERVPELPPAPRTEPFEVRVPHRVSLRRGGAAMVPVVASSVIGRIERVWREGQGLHPDVALAFPNSTLSVLEEGPAVIYDRGSYVGEALLPAAARGEEVRLSYARDTAVRCRRTTRPGSTVTGVKLGTGSVTEEQQREEAHVFLAESDHMEEVEVVFELLRTAGRVVTAEPGSFVEDSPGAVRVRLRAPPQGKAETTLLERWRETRRVDYEQLTPRDIGAWLEGHFIDRSTHDALASVLTAWSQAAAYDEQRGRLEREQQDSIARHAKLREQLAVLGEGGQEGAIRLRFVKDMEREQDRIAACENELRKARDAATQARKRATQTLSVLAAHAERLRPLPPLALATACRRRAWDHQRIRSGSVSINATWTRSEQKDHDEDRDGPRPRERATRAWCSEHRASMGATRCARPSPLRCRHRLQRRRSPVLGAGRSPRGPVVG